MSCSSTIETSSTKLGYGPLANPTKVLDRISTQRLKRKYCSSCWFLFLFFLALVGELWMDFHVYNNLIMLFHFEDFHLVAHAVGRNLLLWGANWDVPRHRRPLCCLRWSLTSSGGSWSINPRQHRLIKTFLLRCLRKRSERFRWKNNKQITPRYAHLLLSGCLGAVKRAKRLIKHFFSFFFVEN